jgi:hypothetical protein
MAQLSNGTGVKPAIAKTDALFAYRQPFRASLRENSNHGWIHFIRDEMLELVVKKAA